MEPTALDHTIINLGKALLKNEDTFELLAKHEANSLNISDLPYLQSRLHNPPATPQDVRFSIIMTQITNTSFRLALIELGINVPLTRDELIELGKRITIVSESEEELQKLTELFDNNVPHPKGSKLFYYPENYNSDTDDISQYTPSIEEVVDRRLKYKPSIL